MRQVAFLAMATVLAGCTPAAQAIRPADRTASEAVDPKGDWQCQAVSSHGEPLVVDLAAHERANLEEAMHDGVAVVSYDCHTLRLLQGCSVDGDYGFMPVSRKAEVVQLDDASELRANLPAGVLAAQLSADVNTGSSLEIAMILVGKRRTTVRAVASEILRGGSACAGATHFIRGAHVGAFALGLSTKGTTRAAASVFLEAEGRSSKVGEYRDGQPETCTQVVDNQPSPTCSALLRLELVGIGHPSTPVASTLSSSEPTASTASPCPAGLTIISGKCARPSEQKPHLCEYRNLPDCTNQCARGDAGSCRNLAVMYYQGEGVAQDALRSIRYFEQACTAGEPDACADAGRQYKNGVAVAKDPLRAAGLFQKGCDAGDPASCSLLGFMYEDGTELKRSPTRAAALLGRACDGGIPLTCATLGGMYLGRETASTREAKPERLPLDPKRGVVLMQRGCDGGVMEACGVLGMLLQMGSNGVPVDEPRGKALVKLACDSSKTIPAELCTSTMAGLPEGTTPNSFGSGFLGLGLQDLEEPELSQLKSAQTSLGVPAVGGVYVTDVQPGSPAAASGFKPNDIVFSMNGIAMVTSAQLRTAVQSAGAGVAARFVVGRGSRMVTLSVTLGKQPAR
jgi:TPR repeat protein